MAMVENPKHAEQLVDKLCARMTESEKLGGARHEAVVGLLSHALTMLPWTNHKVSH